MIRIRSLRARLSLGLGAVVVVALAIVYAIVVPSLERNLINQKVDQLEATARAFGTHFPTDVPAADYIQNASETTNARVVYLARLATPPPMQAQLDSRTQKPAGSIVSDPIAARASVSGRIARGTASREDERYAEVAFPARAGSGDVLLFSAPLGDTLANVRLVQHRVLVAGLVALAVALLLGASAASMFAARLRRLERAADRIAGGMLDEPVVDSGADEVGQLATAFEHMRRRLSQLEHARREFVANASHELRTPIFSLSGFLELLANEDLDDETRDEFLVSMQEQVDRLTRLASELLDLSRLDAGQLRVEREQVDLAEIAGVLADDFRAVALSSSHRLHVAADGDAVAALGDDERILQIGRALVENALRHTPEGTDVEIAASREGWRAALSVTDEGPGIDPEHADHVFDRFYRIDGARASGSGLGLAIARELAELMSGRLELDSRPGRTSFRLLLPVPAGTEALDAEAVVT